ncbi:MAG: HAMP domain-containing protein [Proteobacteria bacterium]|nr:HAMP domain-containing protein [Pseudomonadota bacterium]
MKNTIFLKVFSGIIAIILLLSSFIFLFSFRTIKIHYITTLTYELKNLANTLSLTVIPMLKTDNIVNLDSTVKKIGRDINTRITIIAPSGKVLADSKKNPLFMENHRGRPEIRAALKKGFGTSIRYSTTVKKEMLYVAIPLNSQGKIYGVIRVSLFLSDIYTLLNKLGEKMLYSILIITLLSLIAAFIFSRSMSAPIKQLVKAFGDSANGNFDSYLNFNRKDELGDLAKSFNLMNERLKKQFKELRANKEKFGRIISSINEGLLVIDRTGKITLSNKSFQNILSESPENKFYWEIFRNPKLIDSVDRVMKENISFSDEIEFMDKIYLFSFSFVTANNELIVVLHDITKFKKLEKIKKDLVANVSHELRTPLTAIKGYLETMEDESGENFDRYLDIVERHTDRLINMVNDLLQLSELEKSDHLTEKENVDLKKLAKNVIEIFKKKADDKNISLILDAHDSVFFNCDSFKIEQMLINLIDNAIKYTDKGEVLVSIKKENNKILLKVSDTGIGIPSEYLDRIFERFYVIDKSRSRMIGGTGLGLSIVKHIVLLHMGKITVDSILGKGTTFTVIFPPSKD